MKKLLLATTSLFSAGLIAGPAVAADGIKLQVGGFFKEAYMVVIDDNDQNEFGFDHNTDGFFNDAEVHFTGSTVLDNGLEVGARIELEGETDDDQIDEAWIYFAGGFGEVRIGSDDDALANSCIVPPGGTGDFSAFSPNQWGSNAGLLSGFGASFGTNTVCTGVDNQGDAQKLIYITPNFAGFQLALSYTPNGEAETHLDGVGPHAGMPSHTTGDERHDVSAYATYSYDGEGWGVTAGLGGSWEGHGEETDPSVHINERDFYQAAINVTFGNFGIGIVGEYFNDILNLHAGPFSEEIDAWVAGIGASYTYDAWTFGAQYSHRDDDDDFEVPGISAHFHTQQDRVVGTVNYAMGPGMNVDAEIGYTWFDSDPEIEDIGIPFFPAGLDDYQALEIGIGTNITF